MTTSIRATSGRRGFTLVELLIGMTVSAIMMAGVLSSFLMFTRTGVATANYAKMEAASRRAIESLAQDLRMARSHTWNSSTSLTLNVPTKYTSTGNQVTYYLQTSAKEFRRKAGAASSTETPVTLCGDVETLTFSRYSRNNATATSELDTKRIQLTMQLRTMAVTTVDQTTLIISASYVMRNAPSN